MGWQSASASQIVSALLGVMFTRPPSEATLFSKFPEPFSATSITYSPNGESVLLTDDGSTSGESAAVKGEATFLLVFEANEEEETLDGEGLAPVQEGESYVENDSFDSLAEDSFEQDLGRRSVGCQGEVAEGLSAVFEEADYSTVSA